MIKANLLIANQNNKDEKLMITFRPKHSDVLKVHYLHRTKKSIRHPIYFNNQYWLSFLEKKFLTQPVLKTINYF